MPLSFRQHVISSAEEHDRYIECNRRRIIDLIREAEDLRTSLGVFLYQSGRGIEGAPAGESNIWTPEISSVALPPQNGSTYDFDSFTSPTSTIYLRSNRSQKQDDIKISGTLRKILPTIQSSVHRKALIAIDQQGIGAVKFKNGFTALHWAYRISNHEVVQYLLSRGADPGATDSAGMKPEDYAPWCLVPKSTFQTRSQKHLELDSLHLAMDMDSLTPLHRRALESVAKHGWNSVKWAGGWTILHWAFQTGRKDVIEYCRSLGVSFDLPDKDGKCPHEYAKS